METRRNNGSTMESVASSTNNCFTIEVTKLWSSKVGELDPESIPLGSLNLVATSEDASLLFIAASERIYIYDLTAAASESVLLVEPTPRLTVPSSRTRPDVGLSRQPQHYGLDKSVFVIHIPSLGHINSIAVGRIGNQPVLIAVTSSSYVLAYFYLQPGGLDHPMIGSTRCSLMGDDSAWSIAISPVSPIAAVGSNAHAIFVFDFSRSPSKEQYEPILVGRMAGEDWIAERSVQIPNGEGTFLDGLAAFGEALSREGPDGRNLVELQRSSTVLGQLLSIRRQLQLHLAGSVVSQQGEENNQEDQGDLRYQHALYGHQYARGRRRDVRRPWQQVHRRLEQTTGNRGRDRASRWISSNGTARSRSGGRRVPPESVIRMIVMDMIERGEEVEEEEEEEEEDGEGGESEQQPGPHIASPDSSSIGSLDGDVTMRHHSDDEPLSSEVSVARAVLDNSSQQSDTEPEPDVPSPQGFEGDSNMVSVSSDVEMVDSDPIGDESQPHHHPIGEEEVMMRLRREGGSDEEEARQPSHRTLSVTSSEMPLLLSSPRSESLCSIPPLESCSSSVLSSTFATQVAPPFVETLSVKQPASESNGYGTTTGGALPRGVRRGSEADVEAPASSNLNPHEDLSRGPSFSSLASTPLFDSLEAYDNDGNDDGDGDDDADAYECSRGSNRQDSDGHPASDVSSVELHLSDSRIDHGQDPSCVEDGRTRILTRVSVPDPSDSGLAHDDEEEEDRITSELLSQSPSSSPSSASSLSSSSSSASSSSSSSDAASVGSSHTISSPRVVGSFRRFQRRFDGGQSEGIGDREAAVNHAGDNHLNESFREMRGTDHMLRRCTLGHEHNIPHLRFSNLGYFLSSASIDKTFRVWRTERFLKEEKPKLPVASTAIDSDPECVAVIQTNEWCWSSAWMPIGAIQEVDIVGCSNAVESYKEMVLSIRRWFLLGVAPSEMFPNVAAPRSSLPLTTTSASRFNPPVFRDYLHDILNSREVMALLLSQTESFIGAQLQNKVLMSFDTPVRSLPNPLLFPPFFAFSLDFIHDVACLERLTASLPWLQRPDPMDGMGWLAPTARQAASAILLSDNDARRGRKAKNLENGLEDGLEDAEIPPQPEPALNWKDYELLTGEDDAVHTTLHCPKLQLRLIAFRQAVKCRERCQSIHLFTSTVGRVVAVATQWAAAPWEEFTEDHDSVTPNLLLGASYQYDASMELSPLPHFPHGHSPPGHNEDQEEPRHHTQVSGDSQDGRVVDLEAGDTVSHADVSQAIEKAKALDQEWSKLIEKYERVIQFIQRLERLRLQKQNSNIHYLLWQASGDHPVEGDTSPSDIYYQVRFPLEFASICSAVFDHSSDGLTAKMESDDTGVSLQLLSGDLDVGLSLSISFAMDLHEQLCRVCRRTHEHASRELRDAWSPIAVSEKSSFPLSSLQSDHSSRYHQRQGEGRGPLLECPMEEPHQRPSTARRENAADPRYHIRRRLSVVVPSSPSAQRTSNAQQNDSPRTVSGFDLRESSGRRYRLIDETRRGKSLPQTRRAVKLTLAEVEELKEHVLIGASEKSLYVYSFTVTRTDSAVQKERVAGEGDGETNADGSVGARDGGSFTCTTSAAYRDDEEKADQSKTFYSVCHWSMTKATLTDIGSGGFFHRLSMLDLCPHYGLIVCCFQDALPIGVYRLLRCRLTERIFIEPLTRIGRSLPRSAPPLAPAQPSPPHVSAPHVSAPHLLASQPSPLRLSSPGSVQPFVAPTPLIDDGSGTEYRRDVIGGADFQFTQNEGGDDAVDVRSQSKPMEDVGGWSAWEASNPQRVSVRPTDVSCRERFNPLIVSSLQPTGKFSRCPPVRPVKHFNLPKPSLLSQRMHQTDVLIHAVRDEERLLLDLEDQFKALAGWSVRCSQLPSVPIQSQSSSHLPRHNEDDNLTRIQGSLNPLGSLVCPQAPHSVHITFFLQGSKIYQYVLRMPLKSPSPQQSL